MHVGRVVMAEDSRLVGAFDEAGRSYSVADEAGHRY